MQDPAAELASGRSCLGFAALSLMAQVAPSLPTSRRERSEPIGRGVVACPGVPTPLGLCAHWQQARGLPTSCAGNFPLFYRIRKSARHDAKDTLPGVPPGHASTAARSPAQGAFKASKTGQAVRSSAKNRSAKAIPCRRYSSRMTISRKGESPSRRSQKRNFGRCAVRSTS